MSWVIGTITLSPSHPNSVRGSEPTEVSPFSVGGALPIIICPALGAKTLTLSGELWKPGYSMANLKGSIDQLGSYKGTTVLISDPDGRHSGTWLMSGFQENRVAEGGQAKWGYELTFIQGQSFVIL